MKRSIADRYLMQQVQLAHDRKFEGIATIPLSGMRARSNLILFIQIAAGIILGIAIWMIMACVMNSHGATLHFPTPFEALNRLKEYLMLEASMYGHSIYEHIFESVKRLILAFSAASAIGITLGCVLGYFSNIFHIGMVPVSILQMIPGLAWLPVAVLLFGLGSDAAIFIIFAVSFTVITIGVASSIRMVPLTLINAAKMTGATGFTLFAKVLIPQAGAGIINAMRVGMASAWRVLIAAEMVVGTGIGIGYSIQLSRDLLDYVGSFACIATICLIGMLIDRIALASIERWLRNRLGIEAE